MEMHDLIGKLQHVKVYLLPPEALDDVLDNCNTILERDTLISGYIRILKWHQYYLTQETTDKNEIALRLFRSKEEAEYLVNDHLNTYEDMWNGCGCKVNYYS